MVVPSHGTQTHTQLWENDNEWVSVLSVHPMWQRKSKVSVSYLLMLWHMRGMSLARNMSDSQCGDSLLVTPHT